MATKNQPKGIINSSETFLAYQQSIISHPNYKGMPDIYKDDKTIQWEAPSNRASGKFQFTHDIHQQLCKVHYNTDFQENFQMNDLT